MKNLLILFADSKAPLMTELLDQAGVDRALQWQGEHELHTFIVVKLHNRELVNVFTGAKVQMGKGIYTQEAYEAFYKELNLNPFDSHRRHAVKVQFDGGEFLETEITGTPNSICDYYIGQQFNLGGEDDKMRRGVAIWFWDGCGHWLKHKRSIAA